MTAYDPAIARFATEGKNVNSTYDDKIERDVMLEESNNILFPNDTTMKNYSEHKMDLQVVDEDQKIKAFIEVERSRYSYIDNWKNVGVLQRKVKSVLEFSAIAPVIMVFLNISTADTFEQWLLDKKDLIINSQIVKISFLNEFNAKSLKLNRKDSSYIILYPEKNLYQLKFLNNIIYYDGKKMDQYNSSSKQLFRYKTDKMIVAFIEKLISDKIFNRSKYKLISNWYYFNDISTINNDSILIKIGNSDTIQYRNNEYSYKFYNINIKVLDENMFKNELLFNKIDTNQVEIFNFIQ